MLSCTYCAIPELYGGVARGGGAISLEGNLIVACKGTLSFRAVQDRGPFYALEASAGFGEYQNFGLDTG